MQLRDEKRRSQSVKVANTRSSLTRVAMKQVSMARNSDALDQITEENDLSIAGSKEEIRAAHQNKRQIGHHVLRT